MQRYFISEKEYMESIILSDDVFHIVKVMRNKVGDLIEICYDNKAYLAKITNLSNELVNFEVVEEISNKKQNKPNITLIQGLAKGDKNDDITKHSTELGVDEIILLQMKRSIVKIEANKVDAKLNRYKKIAKEASEQSHRNSIPEVRLLTNLNNIDFNNYDLKLLLDEEEAKKIDGRLLRNIDFNDVKNVIFVIGPEGGIDDKERLYFIEKGFIPVSIGNNILRTETASLAFLAMMNYIYMKN